MIGELLGRLHPLIVHLPVGILMLAFVMEVATRIERFRHLTSAVGFVLGIAILSSLVAWLTGWVMPKEGEFDERLLDLHLWLASGLTVCSVLVYCCHISKHPLLTRLYMPLFTGSMLLLAATGHYGGSLTHGEDHLTAPLAKPVQTQVATIDSLYIYADVIQPLLKQRCYSCHNAGKKKGGLVMSTIDGLMRGGDLGPIIVKGNSAASSIVQRLLLPLDDEEHMPPKGKRQLTDREVDLLDWWVSSGATFAEQVDTENTPEDIHQILEGYISHKGEVDPAKVRPVTEDDLSRLRASGIQVFRESEQSPLLIASMSRSQSVSKNALKKLIDVAENIVQLDLSQTNTTDDMLAPLAELQHLQVLKLQQTNVTSKGIEKLKGLDYLSTLNLYKTAVDDEALAALSDLTGLQTLYTWQTDISTAALADFKTQHPALQIENGVDKSLFGTGQLRSPLIQLEESNGSDTTTVVLRTSLPGVTVYYTLDGQQPDSLSTLYTEPIRLTSTTEVNAVAYKEGWGKSTVSKEVVTHTSYAAEVATLTPQPSSKYPGDGTKTLLDNSKGSRNFGDGSWLGFEATGVTIDITLDAEKTVANVVLGVLEDTGSYIFKPKSIAVYTSLDGKSFDLAKVVELAETSEPRPPHYESLLVSIPPQQAKHVRLDVQSTLKNPDWHAAPGADNWLFVDEVIVN